MRKLNCILIVDDNPGDIYLHSYLLKYCGFCTTIKKALSGKEALKYLHLAMEDTTRENPIPELILLDINMPGMNGFEFIREFSKLDPHLREFIIIVMVTSSTDPKEMIQAQRVEYVKDYIIKPMEQEKMEELMSKYF